MVLSLLEGHVPQTVLYQIPSVETTFSVNTPLRLSHFLAQCAHESWNFTATTENLNYSEEALNRVFGKYFKDGLASQYARKAEKIGSRVYANRMGNGDEASGEGFKFRGRGYIQLTGKVNYISFNRSVPDDNLIENPELVATKYPLLSAGWYWNSRNLNAVADQGSSSDIVLKITKAVNGGTNGLADRQALFTKFFALFE